MSKKKLLYITKVQFGHHTISYNYCKYLQDDFDIDFICFDENKKKVPHFNINVIYLPHSLIKYFNLLIFLTEIYKLIKTNKYDICFLLYFRFNFILPILFPNVQMIMDVRTAAIDNIQIRKFLYDKLLQFEAGIFKNVTVGTESLAEELHIQKKSYVLPIGAEVISINEKRFNELKLLYVGTFDFRKIEDTIYGVELFLKENKVSLTYDIIGNGKKVEENELQQIVKEKNLDNCISVHGYIPQTDVKPYFDKCNVGISYVPLTRYFQNQPVTKTFEYALSGLVVLGTGTNEHKKILSEHNGILINDTPESFAEGLRKLFNNRGIYSSNVIRNSLIEYNYKNIVKTNMLPFLLNIINTDR